MTEQHFHHKTEWKSVKAKIDIAFDFWDLRYIYIGERPEASFPTDITLDPLTNQKVRLTVIFGKDGKGRIVVSRGPPSFAVSTTAIERLGKNNAKDDWSWGKVNNELCHIPEDDAVVCKFNYRCSIYNEFKVSLEVGFRTIKSSSSQW